MWREAGIGLIPSRARWLGHGSQLVPQLRVRLAHVEKMVRAARLLCEEARQFGELRRADPPLPEEGRLRKNCGGRVIQRDYAVGQHYYALGVACDALQLLCRQHDGDLSLTGQPRQQTEDGGLACRI